MKLLVKETDAAAAEELLSQKRVEGFDVEGMGHFTQPRCPRLPIARCLFQGIEQTSGLPFHCFGRSVPNRTSWLALRFLRRTVGGFRL